MGGKHPRQQIFWCLIFRVKIFWIRINGQRGKFCVLYCTSVYCTVIKIGRETLWVDWTSCLSKTAKNCVLMETYVSNCPLWYNKENLRKLTGSLMSRMPLLWVDWTRFRCEIKILPACQDFLNVESWESLGNQGFQLGSRLFWLEFGRWMPLCLYEWNLSLRSIWLTGLWKGNILYSRKK